MTDEERQQRMEMLAGEMATVIINSLDDWDAEDGLDPSLEAMVAGCAGVFIKVFDKHADITGKAPENEGQVGMRAVQLATFLAHRIVELTVPAVCRNYGLAMAESPPDEDPTTTTIQ